MDTLYAESQVQKMLSLIYQIPLGLIETDDSGQILQMNAKASQLMLPLFFSHSLTGENLHDLLKISAPNLLDKVQASYDQSGLIIIQERQEIPYPDISGTFHTHHFVFTVNRLADNSTTYTFDDITELYERDQELHRIIRDKAIERSKFETATGVLHDIGNAVVGFGSYIVKMKRSVDQTTTSSLQNLTDFINKNKEGFGAAIGAQKAGAMVDLLNGLITQQQQQQQEMKNTIAEQMRIISHIQSILSIQRQYVKGQSSERAPINIRSVVNDAASILMGSLEKNGIRFTFDAPTNLPKLRGDQTQLIQVFTNLFKNGIDSLIDIPQDQKELSATLFQEDEQIVVHIRDNGKGFDEQGSQQLFTRGYSTKKEGSGLGLINCRSIIEAHNGTIALTSEGPDKGATVTIVFNLTF
jgi:signal transduction histidine kinase